MSSSFFPQPQPAKPHNLVPQATHRPPQAATAASAAPAAFQGDIAAIAIENIFQLFDFAALSGKLVVNSASNSGSFFFRKGVLIHGLLQVSNRKIGQILLESGLLSKAQLEECLHLYQQTNPPQRFGQFLIENGYIARDRLEKSLLSQAKEAFFEVLSWNAGTFCYYPDQMPDSAAVKMYARIDHLLLEGMIHIDQSALND